jgi:hypothetical protein
VDFLSFFWPSLRLKSIFIIKGDDEVDALIRVFGDVFQVNHQIKMLKMTKRSFLSNTSLEKVISKAIAIIIHYEIKIITNVKKQTPLFLAEKKFQKMIIIFPSI